jgi:hypothetical protein
MTMHKLAAFIAMFFIALLVLAQFGPSLLFG